MVAGSKRLALAAVALASMGGLAMTGIGGAATNAQPTFEDRLAIEKTMQDYVRALDASDLPAYLATLTEDARFLSREGNYDGRQAIADYVRPVMDSRQKKRRDGTATDKGTHHVVTNESLSFTDASHAVMRSYWMFALAQTTGGINVSLMGSSEDHFVKQDGKWLISERHVETL